ncbi:MAG: HEAT repeat domain-containing protein, partial [Planctomycetota bacterium]
MPASKLLTSLASCLTLATCWTGLIAAETNSGAPYHQDVARWTTALTAADAGKRASAIEWLAQMREDSSQDTIRELLQHDRDAAVRREAAMYLGWVGDGDDLAALAAALDDRDWTVRQAAGIAVQTITGLDHPFDALADDCEDHADTWQQMVASLDPGPRRDELLAIAEDAQGDLYTRCDALRALARLSRTDSATAERLIALTTTLIDTYQRPKILTYDDDPDAPARAQRHLIQAAIRAVGRLGQPGSASEQYLITGPLTDTTWAAYAMEALLDCGGTAAVDAAIALLPAATWIPGTRSATTTNYKKAITFYAPDDGPRFSSPDRVARLAHHCLDLIARHQLSAQQQTALRAIAPSILATLPSHFDATVMYHKKPIERLISHVLNQAGVRNEAINAAFSALGQPRSMSADFEHAESFLELAAPADTPLRYPPFAGEILAACSHDNNDHPLLIDLLDHGNGWVRIQAARAVIHRQVRSAGPELRRLLDSTPSDASHGLSMD